MPHQRQDNAYLKSFFQGFYPILLAREIGSGVAILRWQEQHLGVALVPDLRECLDGQLAVIHALPDHVHLCLQHTTGLKKRNKRVWYHLNLILKTAIPPTHYGLLKITQGTGDNFSNMKWMNEMICYRIRQPFFDVESGLLT